MYNMHTRLWIPPTLLGMFVNLINPSTSAAQSVASSVTVNVNGLRSTTGNVVVCLWRQQDQDFPICSGQAAFRQLAIKPTTSSITATFQDIPPGDYAVSAFLDENQNGKIDRNFMGMPKEAIGFSNMTKPEGGQDRQRPERPSFERSKFTVNGARTVALSLMYFQR